MNYKQELEKYTKEVARLALTQQAEADKAWSEIVRDVDTANNKEDKRVLSINEAPCSVCGKSSFVLKYRNVVGKVKGRIDGSFSLFGGSISGYVDGSTETLPVLSCRGCENERVIVVPRYETYHDRLKYQYPKDYTYSGGGTFYPATKWLQSKGVEVAILLEEKVYFGYVEQENMSVKNRSAEWLNKAKLNYKYEQPKKPSRWKCFWN